MFVVLDDVPSQSQKDSELAVPAPVLLHFLLASVLQGAGEREPIQRCQLGATVGVEWLKDVCAREEV